MVTKPQYATLELPLDILSSCMHEWHMACTKTNTHINNICPPGRVCDEMDSFSLPKWAEISQSVQRLATDRTVRGSNPGE